MGVQDIQFFKFFKFNKLTTLPPGLLWVFWINSTLSPPPLPTLASHRRPPTPPEGSQPVSPAFHPFGLKVLALKHPPRGAS